MSSPSLASRRCAPRGLSSLRPRVRWRAAPALGVLCVCCTHAACCDRAPQVAEFVTAFDLPGVDFVPLRISEGERACAFTWLVRVNGADGPQGVSFYEVDESGAVVFIRDIPAPSIKPPPLAALAATVDPLLRVFTPRQTA